MPGDSYSAKIHLEKHIRNRIFGFQCPNSVQRQYSLLQLIAKIQCAKSMQNGHYKIGKIHFYTQKNGGFIVSKLCPPLSQFREIFSQFFIIPRRETGSMPRKEIKQILAVRIVEPYFVGIFGTLPTRNAKKTSIYCTPYWVH